MSVDCETAMKTLMILRHAKAEPIEDGQADRDRPLAPRGEKDALRIGHWLKEQQLLPDWIVSSSAVRAKTTAQLVADACGYEKTIDLRHELYLASPVTYVQVLHEIGDDAERILVVGHNPTLDELLYLLCGHHDGFPTGGLAVVELQAATWEEVRLPTQHKLVQFVRGKEL
jgi:phosphohistidine phosphatase